MKLYVDLDTNQFIEAPGFRNPVNSISFKRGDSTKIEVSFLTGGVTVTELGDDSETGVFGLKVVGDYDGDFVASAGTWTKTGTGTTALYTFDLNLATTELNALLGVGPGADVASVTLMAELQWTVGSVVTSSPTLAAVVSNDVVRGSESGPAEISAGVPVNAVTAVKTYAVVSVPNSDDTLVITVNGVAETWILKETPTLANHIQLGTDWPTVAGYIRTALATASAFVTVTGSGANMIFTARTTGTVGSPTITTSAAVPWFSLSSETAAVTATAGVLGSQKVVPGTLYVVSSVTSGIPTWQKTALSNL